MRRLFALALMTGSFAVAACAADSSDDPKSGESEIFSSKKDEHWFYAGPLPMLQDVDVTASLKGHTAHVTGTLPAGTLLPDLPHVKTKPEGTKLRVDIVYPIATARPGKSNARPGNYRFEAVRAYRPNGVAFTADEGEHFVTWGGFPFIAYHGGIAFHGPITDGDNEAPGNLNVWFLKRGTVSGGCNRMMGEHVVEMTHVVGVNMRKIYNANDPIRPTSTADVKVISDYDTYDGKFIDVDYPTDVGVVRPGTVHGTDKVAMFGSWVATETPDGADLPPDMKWEGGVQGKLYDFQEHARRGFICSMPKASLPQLKEVASRTGGALPVDFCTKKLACDQRIGRVCKVSEIGL
jgi:hypothetical protein